MAFNVKLVNNKSDVFIEESTNLRFRLIISEKPKWFTCLTSFFTYPSDVGMDITTPVYGNTSKAIRTWLSSEELYEEEYEVGACFRMETL